MKVKRAESSHETIIIISMVTDRIVLGAITSKWVQPGLFSSRWSNLVGGWCVDYYQRYNKPPGKHIEQIFDAWAREADRDKETVGLVEKFLAAISKQHSQLKEDLNPDYVLDLCSVYFTKHSLSELRDEIDGCLESGNVQEALEKVNKYHKVEIGAGAGIDVLEDMEAFRKAFEAKQEPLIKYPDGLGRFFGSALERDGFIAFMAIEKRGKSWALLDIVFNAMTQRKKVAFFQVGDMSQDQVMRRLAVRFARKPLVPCVVHWPTSIEVERDKETKKLKTLVEYDEREFKQALSWQEAWKAAQNIKTRRTKSNKPLLKMSVHPNSSISVRGIESILDGWERQGFVADTIVIDYADILAPIHSGPDSREQINTTWKALRSMSQTRHCLVVTATQAKASAYSIETMSRADFSEDKRKLAHATGVVGINANDAEIRMGVVRYNWVVLREDYFSERDCCHIARCLPLANPAVCSIFRRKTPN